MCRPNHSVSKHNNSCDLSIALWLRCQHGVSVNLKGVDPVASDIWQTRANRRDARRRLVAIRRCEAIAQRISAAETNGRVFSVLESAQQATRRRCYEHHTGIWPEERHEATRLLEEITITGALTAEQAIQTLRGRLRNACDGAAFDDVISRDSSAG